MSVLGEGGRLHLRKQIAIACKHFYEDDGKKFWLKNEIKYLERAGYRVIALENPVYKEVSIFCPDIANGLVP